MPNFETVDVYLIGTDAADAIAGAAQHGWIFTDAEQAEKTADHHGHVGIYRTTIAITALTPMPRDY